MQNNLTTTLKRAGITLAVLIAVMAFAPATVFAADLHYGDGAPRAESPYDDPRYAEIYGRSDREYSEYRGGDRYDYDRYARRDNGVYRDDKYAGRYQSRDPYLRSFKDAPVEQVYNDRRYVDRHYSNRHRSCLGRRGIKQVLRADGWHRFTDFDTQDDVVCLKASRRGSGRRFMIEMDRCTGDIIAAKPLGHRYRY